MKKITSILSVVLALFAFSAKAERGEKSPAVRAKSKKRFIYLVLSLSHPPEKTKNTSAIFIRS